MDEKERRQAGLDRCRECIYRSGGYTGSETPWACDYMAMTGHARSKKCGPGLDCTEYRKGDRLEIPATDFPKPEPETKKRHPGPESVVTGQTELEAVRLYEEGWSDQRIANALGVNKNTVWYWRQRTKRPANRNARRACPNIVDCIRRVANGETTGMTLKKRGAEELLALLEGRS